MKIEKNAVVGYKVHNGMMTPISDFVSATKEEMMADLRGAFGDEEGVSRALMLALEHCDGKVRGLQDLWRIASGDGDPRPSERFIS